jgi:predicted phage terminase large subunit-like protein
MSGQTGWWLSTPALFAAAASSTTQQPWLFAAHLREIDRLLRAAARGGVRAMINIPPRHGKSELVCRYFPPWYLHCFPDRRVILVSYEAEVAARWGAASRRLVTQHAPSLGISVASDSAARHRWDIAGRRGGMLTSGIGGPLTGYGADVLIIDDPVKDAQTAASEAHQERAWDWYRSVALPRLEPNGSIIIIQTRWHEADLTGKLLDHEPGAWEQLILPAIALDDDPIGRAPGEALWPQRFPLEQLDVIRASQSDYWWNAQYQQAPSPPGGACFHRAWFRHHTQVGGGYVLEPTLSEPEPRVVQERECRRFTTIDSAASQRTSADYSVIATWDASSDGRLFLVDLIRRRFETPDIAPAVRRVFDTLHPLYLVVEKDGLGLAVLQALQRLGLPVRSIRAKDYGDKWGRAQDAVAKMENGRISWPRHMHEFEEELAAFPHGAHDDQVDTLAYAAIHQSQMGRGSMRTSVPRARLPDPRGSVGRRGV